MKVNKRLLIIIILAVFLLIASNYLCFAARGNKNQMPPVYINALESSGNGYGYDPGYQKEKRNYPMARALIASAETNRYLYTHDKYALQTAIQHADWLVENKDINNDGIVGWGLPFDWDAFGDKTKNPPHTEYTITTALVICALLDVADAIDKTNIINKFQYEGKKEIYFRTAREAINDFIKNKFYTENLDETIFFWYSSGHHDSKFVTNANAMFIGSLQRISTYPAIDKKEKKLYQRLADKGMTHLLQVKNEKDGGWYWLYCPGRESPHENHGVHAAYTADGLLMYKRYNGSLHNEIDKMKVLTGLKLYSRDNKMLAIFSRSGRSIRSWGLGYFLYVISKYYPQESDIQRIIYQEILERQGKNGFRCYEHQKSSTNFIRFNAHVLLGLSKYFWNSSY